MIIILRTLATCTSCTLQLLLASCRDKHEHKNLEQLRFSCIEVRYPATKVCLYFYVWNADNEKTKVSLVRQINLGGHCLRTIQMCDPCSTSTLDTFHALKADLFVAKLLPQMQQVWKSGQRCVGKDLVSETFSNFFRILINLWDIW